MSRLTELVRRAEYILQTEGLISLVRRGYAFTVSHIFRYRTYYVCETDLSESWDEADFLPRIEDYAFRIISTNQEADELEAEGLEFRSRAINARVALDKGAVAFCIFVKYELASIGWVAFTQQAMDTLNEPPCKVDFQNGEAGVAGVWTNPKYRRMALQEYLRIKRFQFMAEHGIVKSYAPIAKDNLPSQKGAAKVGQKMSAEARYLKILWWKYWKDKPLA